LGDKGGKPPPDLFVKIREGVWLLSLKKPDRKLREGTSTNLLTLTGRGGCP
jgi:hypothetical protein